MPEPRDDENDLATLDAVISRVTAELAKDSTPREVRDQLKRELVIYSEMRIEIARTLRRN